MQTQKRPGRFSKIIVLLLFLFLIGAAFTQFQADNPVKKPPLTVGPAPSIPAQTVQPVNKTYKIVIDAGHGGVDPGAAGASGREEKGYTLSVAQQVYQMLKQDSRFEPYLTRNDDTFVQLEDRSKYANDLAADALISIHGNTYTSSRVTGTETYYYDEGSRRLAETVHQHLVKEMGFPDRNVRQEQLKVLTHSEVPAILAEIGYLTNGEEEDAMWSGQGEASAAQAIVEAVKQYFFGDMQ